jgi:hypothetical protein
MAARSDGMEIGVKPDPEEGGKTPKKPKALETGQQTLGGFFKTPVKPAKKEEEEETAAVTA